MDEEEKQVLKEVGLLADTYMDVQDMRIRLNNRVRQEEYDEKMKEFMKEKAKAMQKIEKDLQKEMLILLKGVKLYNNWLIYVRGIGSTLAGKLLRYIDFDKAKHVSSLYAYAGLLVDENGKAMKWKHGEKLNFNPKFKTTLYLVGVSFEKNGKGYRKLYDEFKRQELQRAKLQIEAKDVVNYVGYLYNGKPITKKKAEKIAKEEKGEIEVERTKAHIRMRTIRKVEKVFLAHLFIVHEWMYVNRAEVHYQGLKDKWIYMPIIDLSPEDMQVRYDELSWWHSLKDKYTEMGIKPVVV